MAKGDELEERLIGFAVRVVQTVTALPKNEAGRHVADQLLRSGTAPAAHFAEARGAESRKDFVHKLRLALKELNESRIWLKIAIGSGLLAEPRLPGLLQENDELCRIINASIKTLQSGAR